MYRYDTASLACLVAVLVACALQPQNVDGADESAEERQEAMIAILESPDAEGAEKAITCKHLARFGDGRAVPALASLLGDEQLAAWARIALEAIPDPAAGAALRDAVPQLEGLRLVGVINSIGMRADAEAVELLAPLLADEDTEVAVSAAVALGRIGSAAAAGVLAEFLNGPDLADAPRAVRSAVAQGGILCAEQAEDAADALRLFNAVRAADVPAQRKLEATRGAILAQQADGVPELVELLKSEDREEFAMGLWVARELPGPEVTDALVAELEPMTPQRQELLILALVDRADPPPVSLLVQVASSGPASVRITAIRAMRQEGDASCVPVLLAAAAEDDALLATAAAETLEALPGESVDADLVERLAAAEGALRLSLIELVGRRVITDAVPELLEAADDSDAEVRAAAYQALGETLDFARLPWLIDRTIDARRAEEREMIGEALQAAAGRMPDRTACANALAQAMDRADTPAKVTLLEALGAVGGDRALEAIVEASTSPDVVVQDAASRQLGDWMTPDAAPALLQMAHDAAEDRLRIRTLRGYLRIARQFVVPDDTRLEMYHAAMDAALRDEERRLALDVLIRIPSAETLAEATKHLSNLALRDAAAEAAVTIAEKISTEQPRAVAQAMQQVLDSGVGDPVRARAQELRQD